MSESAVIREIEQPNGDLKDHEGDASYKAALDMQRAGISRSSIEMYEDSAIDFLLDSDAPKPKALVSALGLTVGTVGVVSAQGGTGKSGAMALQLPVAVALGTSFFEMEVSAPGSVLVLSAEDDREQYHRRLQELLAHMAANGEPPDRTVLRRRLRVLFRVGKGSLLTQRCPETGECVGTVFADDLIGVARQMPDLRLIVIDPASRTRGGSENSNEDATRFVEVLERIRSATGATVLVIHHVHKGAASNGDGGQGAARGASAFVDGARWAGVMHIMSEDEARSFGVEESERRHFVRLDVPKNSYGPPPDGVWLRRLTTGVLVPAVLERPRKSEKADERYNCTMGKLISFLSSKARDGKHFTRSSLRDYAGRDGLFQVGDKTLRSIVERGLEVEDLGEEPVNGRRVLVVGPGWLGTRVSTQAKAPTRVEGL